VRLLWALLALLGALLDVIADAAEAGRDWAYGCALALTYKTWRL
jgi:hypothetical protein